MSHAHNFKDLSGMKFGRLTVQCLDENKIKSTSRIYWICKCDCGSIISVSGYNLTIGKTKSCGCLRNEITSNRFSKFNKIEFDDKLSCYKGYYLNSDDYFLFDKEDIDIVKVHCWHKDKDGYIVSNVYDNGHNYSIRLHRIIIEKYYGNIDGFDIDHINHNKSDNRKFNIRICTRGENLRNRMDYGSNSGERNIYFDKNRQSYQLNIISSENSIRKRFRNI